MQAPFFVGLHKGLDRLDSLCYNRDTQVVRMGLSLESASEFWDAVAPACMCTV